MFDLIALKDFLQPLLPLFGVAVGAASTGAGALYKSREEHKRIIALALSDLLEVRHRVVTVNELIKFIKKQPDASQISSVQLRNMLEELIPIDTNLDTRFDEAVTLLTGVDPVLAFTLRSKNMFPHLLTKLRRITMDTGEAQHAFDDMESKVVEMVTPYLDEAILQLAEHHSKKTLMAIKLSLAAKNEIEGSLGPLLDAMRIGTGAKNKSMQIAPNPN